MEVTLSIHLSVEADNFTYDGTEHGPKLTVTDSQTNRLLKEGKDYLAEIQKGSDTINPGTVQVKLTGMGNYTGETTVSYEIAEAQTNSDTQIVAENSSNAKKPFTIVQRNVKCLHLKWKTDEKYTGYEVYMATSKDWTYKRVASTSKGKANIEKLKKAKTYYFKLRAWTENNGQKSFSEFSEPMAISTRPSKMKLTSAKSAKKKTVTVKWKRQTRVSGYQLLLRVGKKGHSTIKYITQTNAKKYKYTFKGLKSGAKAKVRVRSYRIVEGKRVYSRKSKVYSVKVK